MWRTPRSEDPSARGEDIRCAVHYLMTLRSADEERVASSASALAGGYAVNAALTEHRFKALATVLSGDMAVRSARNFSVTAGCGFGWRRLSGHPNTLRGRVRTHLHRLRQGPLEPNGKRFEYRLINIFRYAPHGKLAEEWVQYDTCAFLAQLRRCDAYVGCGSVRLLRRLAR